MCSYKSHTTDQTWINKTFPKKLLSYLDLKFKAKKKKSLRLGTTCTMTLRLLQYNINSNQVSIAEYYF